MNRRRFLMSVYNIHAGHCPYPNGAYGAVGIINESIEDRIVKDEVIRLLRCEGHTVHDCTVDYATTKSGCLSGIVKKCNEHKVDLDVSIHLNSGRNDYNGDNSTGGVEVINYDYRTKEISDRICNNISGDLEIRNRGTKYDKSLYVLSNTNSLSLLIECCFVDDADDVNKWNPYKCAEAIVKGILNTNSLKGITQEAQWVLDNKGYWYRRSDGTYPANQWLYLDSWYYFDDKGYALRNTWRYINDNWYYFNDDCRMALGWVYLDGFYYYLSPIESSERPVGAMVTGWYFINDNWYYFRKSKDGDKPTGSMVVGEFDDGMNNYYFFTKGESNYPEGAMLKGWRKKGDKYYWYNTTHDCTSIGAMMLNHWISYGDSKYYLKNDGTMACNETIEIGNKNFSFNENGKLM